MYEIVEKLMIAKGISAYKLAKDTGLQTSMLTNWKQGKYQPKADKLQKIADYFGVSIEYLMTGKESCIYPAEDNTGYYVNEEAAKYAQELFEKPEMKVLFDASKNLSTETILQFAELMKKYGGDNNDD